jgi:signal transduction histidine kinase
MTVQKQEMPRFYGELFRAPAQTGQRSFVGRLITIGVLIPLAITMVYTIRDIQDPVRLAISLILIAAFGGLFLFFTYVAGDRGMLLALAAETVVAGLMNIVPGTREGYLFIIYAVLSAQLGMTLRPRVVVVWFLVLIAMVLVGSVYWYGLDGWLTALGNGAGFFFFVLMGSIMREALLARERSDRLARELRAANDQLQAMSLQAQQLAVSEERNRMARELHDSLGHRLTVAVVQLEGAQRLIPSDPERAARMIGAMREQMKEALGDLRKTVTALRAPLEDELPLGPALERLARGFQDGTGVPVGLQLPEQLPDMPAVYRLALFRVAQESLTNAQRHSTARHVWLSLAVDEQRVVLTASDDGTGFSTESPAGGSGLRGLRERASQLGGELILGEREGGGAKLVFSLPLRNQAGSQPEPVCDAAPENEH